MRHGCKLQHRDSGKSVGQGQPNDPTQLTLTVDYTQAALTALLFVEECGVLEYRRVLHDTRFGVDGLLEDPTPIAAILYVRYRALLIYRSNTVRAMS